MKLFSATDIETVTLVFLFLYLLLIFVSGKRIEFSLLFQIVVAMLFLNYGVHRVLIIMSDRGCHVYF